MTSSVDVETASRTPGVVPSVAVVRLAAGTGLLAVTATTVGLMWAGGSAPESVLSVRGQQVELYGRGLYRYDSVLRAAGNRGTDLVTLVVAVPLLWWAVQWYRRGSVAGALLLAGACTWFLYVYSSLALGAAYNELFLLYVALTSISLWALALAVRSVHLRDLQSGAAARLPRRRLAALLVAAGTLTGLVWLQPVMTGLLTGAAPPMLAHSTTLVTEVLDLAVVAPSAVVTGLLLRRRSWQALQLAVPLLVLLVVLAFAIVSQAAFQLAAGWQFTAPELAGPIGGFLLLGTAAAWLLLRTLTVLDAPPTPGDARAAGAERPCSVRCRRASRALPGPPR